MKSICGIYGIKNTANGKWYIGQSVHIAKRRFRHFYYLKQGSHYNLHLQASWNKYGEAFFEFHILEHCSESMLDIRERVWIEFHKSSQAEFGYNKETGGNSNKHPTAETLKKLSESHLGQERTAETRQKIGKASRGNKYRLGKPQSATTKRRISENMKRYWANNPHKKAKVVAQIIARENTPERKLAKSELSKRVWAVSGEKRKQRISKIAASNRLSWANDVARREAQSKRMSEMNTKRYQTSQLQVAI